MIPREGQGERGKGEEGRIASLGLAAGMAWYARSIAESSSFWSVLAGQTAHSLRLLTVLLFFIFFIFWFAC